VIFLIASAVWGAGDMKLPGDVKLTGDEKKLWFYNGTYYLTFVAPSGLDANYAFVWPLNDGESGQALITNGSGVFSFSDANGVSGGMAISVYDSDEDGDVNVGGGGTGVQSWTQYCIPYLSTTTAFGEIGIGDPNQLFAVNTGGTGYTWLTNLIYPDVAYSKVGIGTTDPAEKLDVVGNLKVSGNLTDGTYSISVADANVAQRFYVTAASGADIMVYDGTTDERFENVAISGDATIAENGTLTIANDAIDGTHFTHNQNWGQIITNGSGTVLIEPDAIVKGNCKPNEVWGDFTCDGTNTFYINNDALGPENLKYNEDFGDVNTDGSGNLELDADCVGAAEIDETAEVTFARCDVDDLRIDGHGVGSLNGEHLILSSHGGEIDFSTDILTDIGSVKANLLPSADNTYDLGSGVLEWKDLYVDGTATIDTATIDAATIDALTAVSADDFDPDGDGIYNIGNPAENWNDLYLTGDLISGATSLTVVEAETAYANRVDTWTSPLSYSSQVASIAFTKGSSTYLVAATDASTEIKAIADYTCDGTADEVQIQAALEALPAVGGTALLSEGTFTLSGTVDIPSKATLAGQGFGSKLIFAAAVGDLTMITNNAAYTPGTRHSPGNTDITLRDLYIDGDKDNRSTGTNDIWTVGFNTVDRLVIKNLYVVNGWTAAIRTEFCSNVTISDNIVDGSGDDAIAVNNETYCCVVEGNICSNAGSGKTYGAPCGIEVQDDSNSITVCSNICIDNASHGIQISAHSGFEGPTNITISGNQVDIIDSTNDRGIGLVGVSDSDIRNVTITGNSICYDDSNSTRAIYLIYSQGVTITGNTVETSETAIYVAGGTTEVVISGNSMIETGGNGVGIDLNGTNSNMTISGNIIEDFYYGISLAADLSLTKANITDNVLTACTNPVKQFAGFTLTDCRLENNIDADETATAAAPALQPWGYSEIDSSSNVVAATLADGYFTGQLKTIVMTDATNSSTVTVASHEDADGTVATFDDVDETWVLVWTGTEWATAKTSAGITKTFHLHVRYTNGGVGNQNYVYGIDLDADADETVYWFGMIPEDMEAGTDIVVYFRWCPTVTNSSGSDKYVRWWGNYNTASDTGAIGSGTAIAAVLGTVPDAEVLNTIHERTFVTISGAAAGDFVSVRLGRDADNASDTYADDAMVWTNAHVEYTARNL
jgi:hypothetical protein